MLKCVCDIEFRIQSHLRILLDVTSLVANFNQSESIISE